MFEVILDDHRLLVVSWSSTVDMARYWLAPTSFSASFFFDFGSIFKQLKPQQNCCVFFRQIYIISYFDIECILSKAAEIIEW